MDLSSYGNILQNYKHETREVRSLERIITPQLILKPYDMHKKGFLLPIELITANKEFLEQEIAKGTIPAYLGFGFSILSEEMLNVVVWGGEYPIVMNSTLYGFRDSDLSTAEVLDIRQKGAFCVWEAVIVAHESKLWRKYLASKRNEIAKEHYLASMIGGVLQ